VFCELRARAVGARQRARLSAMAAEIAVTQRELRTSLANRPRTVRPVRRPLPSFQADVSAEIYLRNVCSCQEILRRNGRG
jgi:hypothetical protein